MFGCSKIGRFSVIVLSQDKQTRPDSTVSTRSPFPLPLPSLTRPTATLKVNARSTDHLHRAAGAPFFPRGPGLPCNGLPSKARLLDQVFLTPPTHAQTRFCAINDQPTTTARSSHNRFFPQCRPSPRGRAPRPRSSLSSMAQSQNQTHPRSARPSRRSQRRKK